MRQFLASSEHRLSFAPPPSDVIDARALAAATAERHTIPAGARFVVFSSTGTFYAKFGDGTVTAAVPGDVTDGSASELNPEAREILTGVTHVSLISPDATVVTLSFYC